MKINFTCSDPLVEQHFPIVPAKKAVPEWFKNIESNRTMGNCPVGYEGLPTIKKCMPVLDMISAGYIVPNAYEQELSTFKDEEGYEAYNRNISHRSGMDPNNGHHHEQCPVEIDGKKKNYFKIELPWKIETPAGYSCLLIQPYYNFDQGFSMLPSIIDTDTYDANYLNLPGVVLAPEVTIAPGQPLLQVIPFKRDDWEMEVKVNQNMGEDSGLKFYLHNMYKRMFHSKKKFN